MNRPAALFDFDGTLTRRDSLLPFLRQVRGGWLPLDLLRTTPWLAGYLLKRVDNGRAKEALLVQSLGGLDWDWLRQQGEHFAKTCIPALLRRDMLERLAKHQAQGHCCVLVSASLDVYLEPWARDTGFDHCLSSVLERDPDGRITGRLIGGNCHGWKKVHRIKQLFARTGKPPRIYAYGDSPGDLPMLQFANEGIWVDGNRLRSWKTVIEREAVANDSH